MNSVVAFFLTVTVGILIGVFLDKVVTPWRVRRWSERIQRDIREGRYSAPVYPVSIVWDENGFSLSEIKTDRTIASAAWSEVTRVTAYKIDLFSYDRICLFFERGDIAGVEVTEDTNRWLSFIEGVHDHLPGCLGRENWYTNVMHPAFAENLTVIFRRASGPVAIP